LNAGDPATRSIAVVKVGGSLLLWRGLEPHLMRVLAEESASGRTPVLIAGGGPFADALRLLDQTHGLGEELSHALAMRTLDFTAEALRGILKNLPALLAAGIGELDHAWRTSRTPILAPGRMIELDDRDSNSPLEHSWRVTSDTIAARIAERLGAGRLVLCKSAPLENCSTIADARDRGLVDPAFPGRERTALRVIYRNLRDPCDQGRELV
jgi:aspartokinase-like uncharacterized kinase